MNKMSTNYYLIHADLVIR